MNQIPALIRVFAFLSLLTVGGGTAALPELKVLTVDVHHWVTFPQLVHLFSVGQLAPGPNMMMIVSIGQWAAGLPGAVIVVLAFFGPTCLLALLVGRLWNRMAKWPWRTSIQKGLAPVAVGLLLAGCLTIAKGTDRTATAIVITLSVLFILLRSKVNPALLILGGAVVGGLVFGPR
jgi:chromate transporter